MIAHPLKVRELIEEIARGEILLPEFQRTYVWKHGQVVQLIDSLYRGYPTGQILLWDTADAPITKGMEGVESTGLPTASQPKVVLDGQQRLTSLYKALAADPQDPVDVCFNLRTEQFQLHRERLDSNPYWISVRSILHHQRHDLEILRAISEGGGPGLEDPKTQTFLDRLQDLRKIGEYQYPIEVFRSDDYEQVTELFVRINSGGTRLRAAELILARLVLRLPGEIMARFEESSDRYEELGFSFDPRFFIRALVAVGTGQSRFRSLDALWKRSPTELGQLWDRTQQALDETVRFVRDKARFVSSRWLRSLNALIPMVAFFAKRSPLAKEVEVGLLRWFYLVSLRSRYSTSPESALDEDLKAVASDRPVLNLLNNVLGSVRSAAVDPDEFDDVGSRSPLFPITYAVARKQGAVDWFSGVPLASEGRGTGRGTYIHTIFPKSLLNKAGVPRKKRDEIANLAFLSEAPPAKVARQSPAEYLAEVDEAHPGRLQAQCIPINPELWQVKRYEDFLAARRELLAAAVNDLIDEPA